MKKIARSLRLHRELILNYKSYGFRIYRVLIRNRGKATKAQSAAAQKIVLDTKASPSIRGIGAPRFPDSPLP